MKLIGHRDLPPRTTIMFSRIVRPGWFWEPSQTAFCSFVATSGDGWDTLSRFLLSYNDHGALPECWLPITNRLASSAHSERPSVMSLLWSLRNKTRHQPSHALRLTESLGNMDRALDQICSFFEGVGADCFLKCSSKRSLILGIWKTHKQNVIDVPV